MRPVIAVKPTSVPNMIPTIDILFQLVIFFMLACQFAVVEQFPISLPENCANASTAPNANTIPLTMIAAGQKGEYELAVGAEKIGTGESAELADKLTGYLDTHLAGAKSADVTINLRLPKNLPYKDAQNILVAVSQSPAKNIQMSVLRETDFTQK